MGDDIRNVLLNEVLKREVLEGDKVLEAKKKIGKLLKPPVKKQPAKVNVDNNSTGDTVL